jgi:hypothetical protein
MNNKSFEVHEYVDEVYGKDVLENYEEDYGLNGLDLLWGCDNSEEVDNLLRDYLN